MCVIVGGNLGKQKRNDFDERRADKTGLSFSPARSIHVQGGVYQRDALEPEQNNDTPESWR
jgi:hypothetical protein